MSTLDADDLERIREIVQPFADQSGLSFRAIFGNGQRGLKDEMAELRGFGRITLALSGLAITIAGFLGLRHP